jgi:hypothetical protein
MTNDPTEEAYEEGPSGYVKHSIYMNTANERRESITRILSLESYNFGKIIFFSFRTVVFFSPGRTFRLPTPVEDKEMVVEDNHSPIASSEQDEGIEMEEPYDPSNPTDSMDSLDD